MSRKKKQARRRRSSSSSRHTAGVLHHVAAKMRGLLFIGAVLAFLILNTK